jgi:hypothetical protein
MSQAAVDARVARNPEALAFAGVSLALHVAAGLGSDDPYLQELAGVILDSWSRGESRHFEGSREELTRLCRENYREKEPSDAVRRPNRG